MDRETRDMLLETAERFFTERCDRAVVNNVEKGIWPADLWKEIEEMGLPLIAVPEDKGGAGGTLADMLAERTVGLELALVEELVGCRFVREGIVAVAIFGHHLVLVAGDARFQVEQEAGLGIAGVHDAADRDMLVAVAAGAQPQRVEMQVDLDAEVDARGAQQGQRGPRAPRCDIRSFQDR